MRRANSPNTAPGAETSASCTPSLTTSTAPLLRNKQPARRCTGGQQCLARFAFSDWDALQPLLKGNSIRNQGHNRLLHPRRNGKNSPLTAETFRAFSSAANKLNQRISGGD